MNKYRFILLALVVVSTALSSCNKISSQEDLDKIAALEKQAEEERPLIMKGQADTAVLAELGRSYIAFADRFPQASQTPEFLFRAGELYSNDLGNMPRALEIFHRNYKEYPDHETASSALFLLAFLNHNIKNDLEAAEKHYSEFLKQFPDHKMAQTAKFELEHLGQSPEDIFNTFEINKDAPANQ